MKKKTIAIGALLLAMNSFSQTDTLAYSVSGNRKCEFDYYTSKITNSLYTKKYEDFTFRLNKNEFLYLDLFDDLNKDDGYLMYREITFYHRDGYVEKECFKSDDNLVSIKGEFIKKVVVHKQELK
tara:strand:+ start:128 stop:502 length:375 start_codon:yes stop_codon:yes gene_type:complete